MRSMIFSVLSGVALTLLMCGPALPPPQPWASHAAALQDPAEAIPAQLVEARYATACPPGWPGRKSPAPPSRSLHPSSFRTTYTGSVGSRASVDRPGHLLTLQCGHRIQAEYPPGRQVPRRKTDKHQEGNHRPEGDWIQGLDPEEKPGKEA